MHREVDVDPGLVASSFALLFLAEMGDKTQLMAMTLATRYKPLPVALGACAAFLVLNLLAALFGGLLFRYVPERVVLVAAGLLFLGFAWNAWRNAADDDADQPDDAAALARSVVLTSFLLIFVAELGDKTQLSLLALAASSGQPWAVFTGGTLALWSVTLLGIAVGATLLSRIPPQWLHRAAAVLFAGFGVLALWQAV
jgi:putative Ca2+/H+ antiporter (TMEM165/GDT1 family)